VKFLLWADSYCFRGVSGQLPSLKDSPDNFYIFVAYILKILLNIFSIGSNVKIKSRHGGHLEFPISKRFTSLVQDHPIIIPAKSQFNWLSGF
jgi:hypothetical protein